MKLSKKIIYASLLMTAIAMAPGCKNYFDLNDNPNLVQEPPINSFLSTATYRAGINSRRVADFTSYYSQYLANPTANGISDTYQISNNSEAWNNLFYAMADLHDFKRRANEINAVLHLGVANTLMAYQISLINDVWGAAPYSQAFATEGVLNPIYDSAESLYTESLNLINEAIVELSTTDAGISLGAEQDIIHGGDRTAWLKTAYALKARLLNKLSKKAIYNPAEVLAVIDLSYESNADDAAMAAFNGNNPWAQIAIGNEGALLGGWLSDNLINQLNGTTYGVVDPRISRITEKTVNGDYVGTRNGEGNRLVLDEEGRPVSNTVKDECYITRRSILTSETSPLIIISYAELKFIEAEAAFALGNIGRAYTAYLEGIRAHMAKLEVPLSEADGYINDASVSVGQANLTRKLIMKEKYIVTYLNPEAWTDMRRVDYDYDGFRMPVNAVLDEPIRQVAYPADEVARNGANVPDQSSLAARLWWDQP